MNHGTCTGPTATARRALGRVVSPARRGPRARIRRRAGRGASAGGTTFRKPVMSNISYIRSDTVYIYIYIHTVQCSNGSTLYVSVECCTRLPVTLNVHPRCVCVPNGTHPPKQCQHTEFNTQRQCQCQCQCTLPASTSTRTYRLTMPPTILQIPRITLLAAPRIDDLPLPPYPPTALHHRPHQEAPRPADAGPEDPAVGRESGGSQAQAFPPSEESGISNRFVLVWYSAQRRAVRRSSRKGTLRWQR
jgi:hypothetical protein